MRDNTDGDGLSDYDEVNGVVIYTQDTVYPSPLLPDTDGDGLTDYEEIYLYHTDPTDEDSDNDGLSDGAEVGAGTNPNNGDTDGDGISDGAEVNTGTDPLSADSDGDGVDDGEETDSETSSGTEDTDNDGLTDYEEMNVYGTDPLNPDTDGDSVSDGKEIEGYEVKVIIPQPDGTQEEVTKVLHGDPLTPYRSIDGALMDADEDGIPDVVEAWFAQANWTWSRSDLHASFMENLSAANAAHLYPDYIWYVDHGKDLDNERVRLELYEQVTGVEKDKPNATQWAQTTFNPFVPDTGPPILAYFEVVSHAGLDGCYAVITYEFRDPSGIDTVKLTKLGAGQNSHVEHFYGAKVASGTATLDLDFWQDYWTDYDINITVSDDNGNTLYGVKKINGVFGGIIDAIRKMWEAFVGAMEAAWKALTEAVNVFITWVKDMIMELVNATIDIISSRLGAFYERFINLMVNAVNELNTEGSMSTETTDRIEAFFNDLIWMYLAIVALVVGLDLLTYVINGITFGVGTMITMVIIPIVMIVVIQEIARSEEYGELVPDGFELNTDIDYVIDFVKNWISGQTTSTQKGIPQYDVLFTDVAWSGFSVMFGIFSFFFALPTIYAPTALPQPWAIAALALGALSWWVFGMAATIIAATENTDVADFVGLMAIIGGLLSLILSTVGMSVAVFFGGAHAGIGTWIALALAWLFGGIAFWMGFQGLSFV